MKYTERSGSVEARLADRRWAEGDPLPEVGSYLLVSGAHQDVESDQHRHYSWRKVIGYANGTQFIVLQTRDCWPTVEHTDTLWIGEIPNPIVSPQGDEQEPVAEWQVRYRSQNAWGDWRNVSEPFYAGFGNNGDCERRKLYASPPALQAKIDAMVAGIDEIVGCFDAAYAEGLHERLQERGDDVREATEPGSLNDLLERRILYAYEKAKELQASIPDSSVVKEGGK